MKFYYSSLLLLLASNTARAQITRTECVNQGGVVVGDIGNGAIFRPDYVCENSGQAPTDTVIPEDTNGEAFAADGEVCCGGTGSGVTNGGGGTFGGGPGGPGAQSCNTDADCPLVQCLVAPCPDAICVNGFCQVEPNPPNPECIQDSDCPPINCFAAPCDVNVCVEGICELQPPPGPPGDESLISEELPGGPLERPTATRQQCTEEFGGTIVGDIGNGAIFTLEYVCESNGQPPIANIMAAEGEPMAIEGEVCCGPPLEVERDTATRQECTEVLGGVVVGDIGDGAIFAPNYICDSNGEPPIADIMPAEGDPIAIEGEVCCGLPLARKNATKQECTELLGGTIVGDIGDGAIFAPDYVCESNGEPPIADIMPVEGEPIAIEGEVCCGPPLGRDMVTRQECTEELGGTIVGDIGDGAIFAPDYVCESNGEPPIADVMPAEGEPIAIEGEVCCGPNKSTMAMADDVTSGTPNAKETETNSGGDRMTFGFMVGAVVSVAALFAWA